MVSGEIAHQANIVSIDIDRVFTKVVGEMIDIRDNADHNTDRNYQSLIGEFVSKNNNSILEIHENKVIVEPRNQLLIRLDTDKKELCIVKSTFRKWLIEEERISPKQFIYQLKQNGIDITEKRKKMASGWKPGLDEFNLNAYIINTDTLPKDVIKEIDPELV